MFCGLFRRKMQVLDKRGMRCLTAGIACHHMYRLRLRDQRVFHRLRDRRACFFLATRQGAQPVLARCNIAAQGVQAQHRQTCLLKRGFHIRSGRAVGPMAFDSFKPCRLGRTNGRGQWLIRPEKTQICRKFCHASHSILNSVTTART